MRRSSSCRARPSRRCSSAGSRGSRHSRSKPRRKTATFNGRLRGCRHPRARRCSCCTASVRAERRGRARSRGSAIRSGASRPICPATAMPPIRRRAVVGSGRRVHGGARRRGSRPCRRRLVRRAGRNRAGASPARTGALARRGRCDVGRAMLPPAERDAWLAGRRALGADLQARADSVRGRSPVRMLPDVLADRREYAPRAPGGVRRRRRGDRCMDASPWLDEIRVPGTGDLRRARRRRGARSRTIAERLRQLLLTISRRRTPARRGADAFAAAVRTFVTGVEAAAEDVTHLRHVAIADPVARALAAFFTEAGGRERLLR